MVNWHDVAADLGYAVGEEDLRSVNLPEMLSLREQYPVTYNTATTNRQRCITDHLDAAIYFALMALRITSWVDDDGVRWNTVLRGKNDPLGKMRPWFTPITAELAAAVFDAAKSVIATDDWDANQDEQDALLKHAMYGDALNLYKGVFSGDSEFAHEDIEEWWHVLGYNSFESLRVAIWLLEVLPVGLKIRPVWVRVPLGHFICAGRKLDTK